MLICEVTYTGTPTVTVHRQPNKDDKKYLLCQLIFDTREEANDFLDKIMPLIDHTNNLYEQREYWMKATFKNSNFFDCLERAVEEGTKGYPDIEEKIFDLYAEYEQKVEL